MRLASTSRLQRPTARSVGGPPAFECSRVCHARGGALGVRQSGGGLTCAGLIEVVPIEVLRTRQRSSVSRLASQLLSVCGRTRAGLSLSNETTFIAYFSTTSNGLRAGVPQRNWHIGYMVLSQGLGGKNEKTSSKRSSSGGGGRSELIVPVHRQHGTAALSQAGKPIEP